MSPLDSSDSDEDVIGTQSPPPVAAAPDARVLEQNQDDSPLINPENRHGITSRDGCEGVRSGPLSSPDFIDLVLDGLKYLVESSEEPVSVMPWNMLAQFINKTNLLAHQVSTGQIKDRVRTIANAVIKRRLGAQYNRDTSPTWDSLSLEEKLCFFGEPCADPPRPSWLAPDVDWALLMKGTLVKQRAQKRRRVDDDVTPAATYVRRNVNEMGNVDDEATGDEPTDYQYQPVEGQQPPAPIPPAANPPPVATFEHVDDELDFEVTADTFSDLVDKERALLRRGDKSGALAVRLTRCGLSKSRLIGRSFASANQQARREKCHELLRQRNEATFPHTAVYLQKTDVTSIAKLERWIVPWLTQTPKDAGIVLSIFERTIGVFATLRALPSERQLPISRQMKVREARKLLDAYTSRGHVDRLLDLAHQIFESLNAAHAATPRPDVSAEEREVKRARAAAAQMHHVLFQISYTTSVFVRMVGIDGRALARDYSLRPVLG